MDPITTLGTILTDDHQRDAIHIAIAPVIADEILEPGQPIGFNRLKDKVGNYQPTIGVVDPFLTADVKAGQTFWMMLLPNTITSLRHDWIHPAFKEATLVVDPTAVDEATRWMQSFAYENNLPYDSLLEAGLNYIENGEAYYTGDQEIWLNDDTFWVKFALITGITKPADLEDSFFRCAC